jgi:hypothetical protein
MKSYPRVVVSMTSVAHEEARRQWLVSRVPTTQHVPCEAGMTSKHRTRFRAIRWTE